MYCTQKEVPYNLFRISLCKKFRSFAHIIFHIYDPTARKFFHQWQFDIRNKTRGSSHINIFSHTVGNLDGAKLNFIAHKHYLQTSPFTSMYVLQIVTRLNVLSQWFKLWTKLNLKKMPQKVKCIPCLLLKPIAGFIQVYGLKIHLFHDFSRGPMHEPR